jgi:predicted transposase YdaD
LLNVDLSTVTTSADLVFGLGEPMKEIVHLDFQSSASASKHADIVVYNALLHRQYRVPVHSVIILLRPQASHPNLDGAVVYAPRPGRGKMDFNYEVVRLWERPAAELLQCDIGALPLAILGGLPPGADLQTGLARIAEQLIHRLDREAPQPQARRLVTAAYVLAGLRLSMQAATDLFKGVRTMRDSVTYMAILEEGEEKGLKRGRIEEARSVLRRQGKKKFGAPGKRTAAAIDAIDDLDRLEMLHERLLDAKSWKELLAAE